MKRKPMMRIHEASPTVKGEIEAVVTAEEFLGGIQRATKAMHICSKMSSSFKLQQFPNISVAISCPGLERVSLLHIWLSAQTIWRVQTKRTEASVRFGLLVGAFTCSPPCIPPSSNVNISMSPPLSSALNKGVLSTKWVAGPGFGTSTGVASRE